MTFDGKKIKAAAAHAGYTLTELATQMGISRATLYAYVAGQIRPSADRIHEVAALTALPVSFFATDGEAKSDRLEQTLKLVEALLSSSNPQAAATLLEESLDEVPMDRRGEVSLRLGNAHIAEGAYQEAIPALMRAKNEFTRSGNRHGAGRAAQSLGFCYAHIGPLSTALSCFQEAEALLNEADRWKPRVALAVVAERRGAFDEALRSIDKVQKSFSDPSVKLYCKGVRGNILASLSSWGDVYREETETLAEAERLDATDQIAERLIAIALASIYLEHPRTEFNIAQAMGYLKSSGDKGRAALFLVVRSLYALQCGDFEEARELAMDGLTIAIKGRYRRAELGAYLRLGEIALAEGNLNEAALNMMKAAAYAESYEYASERDYAEAVSALIDARRGRNEAAQAHLRKILFARGRRNAITAYFAEMASKLLKNEEWVSNSPVNFIPGIEFVPGLSRTTQTRESQYHESAL